MEEHHNAVAGLRLLREQLASLLGPSSSLDWFSTRLEEIEQTASDEAEDKTSTKKTSISATRALSATRKSLGVAQELMRELEERAETKELMAACKASGAFKADPAAAAASSKKKRVEGRLRDAVVELQQVLGLLQLVVLGVMGGEEGENQRAEPGNETQQAPVLLWVDDQPDNNAKEVAIATGLGWTVVQKKSTQEAKEYLEANPDLKARPFASFRIISDIFRPDEGDDAAKNLITWLRENGWATPVMIYCGKSLNAISLQALFPLVLACSSDTHLFLYLPERSTNISTSSTSSTSSASNGAIEGVKALQESKEDVKLEENSEDKGKEKEDAKEEEREKQKEIAEEAADNSIKEEERKQSSVDEEDIDIEGDLDLELVENESSDATDKKLLTTGEEEEDVDVEVEQMLAEFEQHKTPVATTTTTVVAQRGLPSDEVTQLPSEELSEQVAELVEEEESTSVEKEAVAIAQHIKDNEEENEMKEEEEEEEPTESKIAQVEEIEPVDNSSVESSVEAEDESIHVEGPVRCIAGLPTSFILLPRSALLGKDKGVEVDLQGPDDISPKLEATDENNLAISFLPTIAGEYYAHIKVAGVPISNSPYKFKVIPGTCDASTTFLSEGEAGQECVIQAGQGHSFLVSTRDRYGNSLQVGGETFFASVIPPLESASNKPQVVDNDDGTYFIRLTPTQAGEYSLQVLLDGTPILGSPFPFQVAHGRSDAKHCELIAEEVIEDEEEGEKAPSRIAGPKNYIVGKVNTFTILSRDAFGNLCTEGGENDDGEFLVRLYEHSPMSTSPLLEGFVCDLHDGRFTVSYFPTRRAENQRYELHVLLRREGVEEHLHGSPCYVYPLASSLSSSSESISKKRKHESIEGQNHVKKTGVTKAQTSKLTAPFITNKKAKQEEEKSEARKQKEPETQKREEEKQKQMDEEATQLPEETIKEKTVEQKMGDEGGEPNDETQQKRAGEVQVEEAVVQEKAQESEGGDEEEEQEDMQPTLLYEPLHREKEEDEEEEEEEYPATIAYIPHDNQDEEEEEEKENDEQTFSTSGKDTTEDVDVDDTNESVEDVPNELYVAATLPLSEVYVSGKEDSKEKTVKEEEAEEEINDDVAPTLPLYADAIIVGDKEEDSTRPAVTIMETEPLPQTTLHSESLLPPSTVTEMVEEAPTLLLDQAEMDMTTDTTTTTTATHFMEATIPIAMEEDTAEAMMEEEEEDATLPIDD
ncbi:Tripartite motif-containing protein 3 [Balamuthia mandrillaris]